MSRALRAAATLATTIAERSRAVGREVRIDPAAALDRSDSLALGRAGRWSPNRSCRMLRSADGWLAVNLARPDDHELMPAWLGGEAGGDLWHSVARRVRTREGAALLADARLLGLPVGAVGEVMAGSLEVARRPMGIVGEAPRAIVDLSGLWAGPLCGAILAAAGLPVIKIEASSRPDPTVNAMPTLDARLNGAKARLTLDFARDRAELRDRILDAGLVVTSARARAFAPLGLDPADLFAARPGLIWVAVTGHGWASDRVAFGDDAAAAGGLVRWTRGGAPRFAGDALADPLTGLAAAAAALAAIAAGGGVMIDAGMAQVAAGAAA